MARDEMMKLGAFVPGALAGGHAQVHLGQQLGIEQGAVQLAVAVVHA